MKMRQIVAAATLAMGSAVFTSTPARAAYVINVVQTGSDVAMTGNGTINTTSLSYGGAYIGGGGSILGNPANVTVGTGQGAVWIGASGPSNFGGNGQFYLGTDSGAGFGVISGGWLLTPSGYVSGTDLGTSTTIFANRTLATSGLALGSYTWTWGAGDTADSFTVNIGPVAAAAVPEPATWAMMLAGMGAIGFAMRRRQRQTGRYSFG